MSNPVRYLVIGYARSGTTVTHLVLMGHPNVATLNDELRPDPFFTRGLTTFTFGADLPEEKSAGHRALFDAITSIRANAQTLALGAKSVNNSPTKAREIVKIMQTSLPEMKVIHVVRHDVVAHFGSALYGKRSGIMHAWNAGARERVVQPIAIPKWQFVSFALGVLRMNRELRALQDSHAVLELAYEDYLEDPANVHRRLFDFVGVPQLPVTWLPAEKLLPPPESYITNYLEMTRLLEQLRDAVASGEVPATLELPAKVLAKLRSTLKPSPNRASRRPA